MPYDPDLDVAVYTETVPGDEQEDRDDIEFKIACYDGGPPKLQLTRVSRGKYHAKLGRLTRTEVGRVRDKLTEILNAEIEEAEVAVVEEVQEGEGDKSKLPF